MLYRVDQRFQGEGLWSVGSLPMTLQQAYGRAQALNGSRFADDARVVPSQGAPRLLDRIV